uniref:Transposase n=1 Tax=Peronospora matthiolae TaxID=2874970 RepID=A0AAV1T4E3_9STRA
MEDGRDRGARSRRPPRPLTGAFSGKQVGRGAEGPPNGAAAEAATVVPPSDPHPDGERMDSVHASDGTILDSVRDVGMDPGVADVSMSSLQSEPPLQQVGDGGTVFAPDNEDDDTPTAPRSPPRIFQDARPMMPSPSAWTGNTVDELRKAAGSQPSPYVNDVNLRLYECARKRCRLRKDGFQRRMTPIEVETLEAWLGGHLQLAGAPLFLRETHVAAERETFAVHQRSRLVHKLYARLPVGLFLPDLGARGKLFSLMLAAAVTIAAKTRVNSLIMELSRVECSRLSPIVAFVLNDRPTRDSWAKADLRVGNCRLQLLVADDPATVDDKIGYTGITTSMLYQVHVLGKSSAFPSEIRSWVAAATSTPVLTVKSREADGAHFFGAHRWVVTFDSMECPKELDRKHRILVTTVDKSIEAVLMHPRKSTREPCQRCISVRHFRKDCAAVDPDSTCASYTLSATASVTSHTSLTHADGWIKATEILRQKVAPGLGDKLRRASMMEGAPKRQKTVIHKREVAARVEAKAEVTAELLAIRRSKLKAATNHFATVKKAAAMAAAARAAAVQQFEGSCPVARSASRGVAADSLPTSVPQPVSGQHVSLKSCEVAPAAVPAAPGASSEGATSTVVNENDSDARDMATADLPALFVVGEHAVSTVFEVPPSTAVDGQDRTEVVHHRRRLPPLWISMSLRHRCLPLPPLRMSAGHVVAQMAPTRLRSILTWPPLSLLVWKQCLQRRTLIQFYP